MKRGLTVVLVVFVSLMIASGIKHLLVKRAVSEKSVFQYTKLEYLDHATKGCAEAGNPEKYCRCFYNEMLNRYSVQQVLKMDVEAARSDFEPTDIQLQVISRCIE